MPLDLQMLEKIGRPGGRNGAYAVGEELPPTLEEIFARVVRDGWTPRNPANGAELGRLEASTIRGDCTAPLLLPGDIVYTDHHMAPLPGDLVSFAMSQRLADLQNAAPPPGQSPTWKAGDRWIKLLVPYCGIDFLHERFGNSLTATLACCEDPDRDPVVLHPVRQVRRLGRLLFLPDAHCGEIGPNAATDVFVSTLAGPVTYPASGSTVYVAASVTFSPPYDIILQATASWDVSVAGGPLVGGGVVKLYGPGGLVTDDASGVFDSDFRRFNAQINTTASRGVSTTVQVQVPNPSLNTSLQNVSLRVESIKR